jgi:hypothetical protein
MVLVGEECASAVTAVANRLLIFSASRSWWRQMTAVEEPASAHTDSATSGDGAARNRHTRIVPADVRLRQVPKVAGFEGACVRARDSYGRQPCSE